MIGAFANPRRLHAMEPTGMGQVIVPAPIHSPFGQPCTYTYSASNSI